MTGLTSRRPGKPFCNLPLFVCVSSSPEKISLNFLKSCFEPPMLFISFVSFVIRFTLASAAGNE
ncbi:hypothetical protein [Mixta sp. Marseille-Q2659]|uniref:hypothetical protein n=1 Tax=Mixta sp. Marseille-Q2659 TaxID=2736607 RepID=UPI0023B93764|nr:hypothetical protein [Mixta sp. Marseille-Q2659]